MNPLGLVSKITLERPPSPAAVIYAALLDSQIGERARAPRAHARREAKALAKGHTQTHLQVDFECSFRVVDRA